MTRRSVLAHVALQMTEQRERAATEGLAFLLAQSPAARRAVAAILHLGAATVDSAKAEFAVSEESRPDIALFGKDGGLVAFVEGKFWASLTEAQPSEYIKRLKEHRGRRLLFVVPARRVLTLGHELASRAGAPPIDGRPHWWLADDVEIGIVSWRMVLESIASESSAAGDHDSVSDARQLLGLCEAMEDEAFIPLSRADLEDQETARRVIQLAKLIDDATAAARVAGVLSMDGLRPTHGLFSAGRYVRFGNAILWVGLQHSNWREYGRSPFWAAFSSSSEGRSEELCVALSDWLHVTPPRAYRSGEFFLVPLFAEPGVERDVAIRSLVEELRKLRDAVALLPSAGNPRPLGPKTSSG